MNLNEYKMSRFERILRNEKEREFKEFDLSTYIDDHIKKYAEEFTEKSKSEYKLLD